MLPRRGTPVSIGFRFRELALAVREKRAGRRCVAESLRRPLAWCTRAKRFYVTAPSWEHLAQLARDFFEHNDFAPGSCGLKRLGGYLARTFSWPDQARGRSRADGAGNAAVVADAAWPRCSSIGEAMASVL